MLARTKNMCSHYGTYLDLFLDRIADFLVLSGIAVGYYKYTREFILFIIFSSAIALYFMQVCLYYIVNDYKNDEKKGQSAEIRGLVVFMIFLFSVFNLLEIFMVIFTLNVILSITTKIVTFILLPRKEQRTNH